ncbi:hypothetical protein [Mycobacterium sp. SMC-4]|uniref:hypothetical protein n=1 Tax=Mycobacterium sp. SMC-4 TaxID=2857059 RepID=UPI003D050461
MDVSIIETSGLGDRSYLITHDGIDRGVFTGGSTLYGTTGCTDLISPDATTVAVRSRRHA